MSYDELKERAAGWLAPIAGASPTGVSAKADPRYEALVAEVAKLDSPTGGAIDWGLVVSSGGELLKTVSKDLLVASYVSHGLLVTRGLHGLTDGAVLLAELMETYWPALFPELKRIRGRVNALGWFTERSTQALLAMKAGASDRAELEAVVLAANRLSEISREKLEAQAPSLRPMLDAIERLRLSLPAATPATTPAAPRAPERAATPPPAAATATPMPPAALAAPTASLQAGADPTEFLRDVGTSLVEAAGQLRTASPADPIPYRLLRIGLWLHLVQPPPAGADQRTQVPPLAAELAARLDLMAANGRWLELLEETESALARNRFSLDLQRRSAQALQSLGEGYRRAREALIIELRTLLQRMPSLTTLGFNDGSPFAQAATQAWLESDVLASGPGPAGASSRQPAATARESDQLLDGEARKLAGEGHVPEAIALIQERIASCPSGAGRFGLRLQLAELCQRSGQVALARSLFRSLDLESAARNLDEWEPSLAARCLAGALGACGPAEGSQEQLAWYLRLARLDPVAASKTMR